jgi:hypothetical protein
MAAKRHVAVMRASVTLLTPAWLLLIVFVARGQEHPAVQDATEALRPFYKTTIADIVLESPGKWKHLQSHVEVTGTVYRMRTEENGDTRICLCAAIPNVDPTSPSVPFAHIPRGACIDAVIIPAIPVKPPERYDIITVRGVIRYNAERGGDRNRLIDTERWEVHPVESIPFTVKTHYNPPKERQRP